MKLNQEQTATIQQLVYNEVQYNETYLELYDHVITALENQGPITDLQKAYAQILDQDFGGHGNISKMEEKQKRLLSKEISNAKWRMFASLFKMPFLPVTLLVMGSVYYFTSKNLYLVPLISILIGVIMLPPLFIIGGNFLVGLKRKFIKTSIRDDATNLMSAYMGKFLWRLFFLSSALNLAAKLITNNTNLNLLNIPYQIAFTTIFIFCAGHTVSVLMVYRKEYEIRLQP